MIQKVHILLLSDFDGTMQACAREFERLERGQGVSGLTILIFETLSEKCPQLCVDCLFELSHVGRHIEYICDYAPVISV